MSATKASLRGYSRRELVNAVISMDARIEADIEAEAKKIAEAHEAEQRELEAKGDREHKARLAAIRRGELKASDVKRFVSLISKEGGGVTIQLRFDPEFYRFFKDERQGEVNAAIMDAIEKGTEAAGGYALGGGTFRDFTASGFVTAPKDRTFLMNGSGS